MIGMWATVVTVLAFDLNSLRVAVKMQAKNIPDRPVLAFLARLPEMTIGAGWHNLTPREDYMPTVRDAMPPETPEKVALAKMHALIRRGLVDGCSCGCRGDFTITNAGRAYLATTDSPSGDSVLAID